ncbi:sugar ABC transporter permease [Sphaerisporangium sp. TRM90804]|uniref:carbohydrate ABC transporter permease n=1 Tax=Sphaerisporangium sp. TRM90804 TaxID=3031113 RepID=UPI00244A1D3B|nr:sugar ABC transporter permease [Sphaerisporangium sp. TRM90804]MDH2429456.1 sugar ABC transporter permease [Sphaerisporangium sp. TRM90804]
MSLLTRPGGVEEVAFAASSGTSARRMNRWTPYAFLAPYLVLFAVFMVLPIGFGFWTSLHEWDITLPSKPFVGLGNYADLFDPSSVDGSRFWTAMRATGIFTVASVPLLIGLPLLVALLMNGRFGGRNVYRAVYFAPYVLGVAVVGFVWRYLLDGNIGLVNHYLGLDVQWTTDLPAAWVALVGVTVWWTLGLNAVIFLAGLQDIPRELYEAAMVDGAGPLARFRSVTLPGLRPVSVFVVNATILASANMFGQSYLLTSGAPADQTKTAIYLIAETGLRQFDMGTASSMSFVLAGFLMCASALVFAAFRDRGRR